MYLKNIIKRKNQLFYKFNLELPNFQGEISMELDN